ncbi:MAG: dTDP-4-dehydrorhamnose reductase [Holophagaceae bacterium]|nr:dTDP-4-dehydrorhamnose reductase [Holophagaceae bacterium]
MRILLTGGSGQLARALQGAFADRDLACLDHAALDLADPAALAAALRAHRPQVVLNAGAHTGVDLCETQPDLAFRVNAEAVGHLAEGCAASGALLVQVSTDYVFDGLATRPYREADPTGPATVYGRTKLEGEVRARRAPRHLIVRTGWLFEAWGRNFLRTMLRAAGEGRSLRVVADQRGTPTSCRALARQLRLAVDGGWEGLVHATCGGETTWHGFAAEIFRQRGLNPDLTACATADYPAAAPRPAYSVLCNAHRRSLGADAMPDWEEALAEVLADPLLDAPSRSPEA